MSIVCNTCSLPILRNISYCQLVAFSALTLLVGWQEGHPTCKNWVMGCWRGCVWVKVQICTWPSCHCHSLSPTPLTGRAIISHSAKAINSLSLAPENPDWFYLSGAGSPGKSQTKSKRAVKWLCVSTCCHCDVGPGVFAWRWQAGAAFLETVESQECLVRMVYHWARCKADTQSQGPIIYHRIIAEQPASVTSEKVIHKVRGDW